jgi:hypothetical protein
MVPDSPCKIFARKMLITGFDDAFPGEAVRLTRHPTIPRGLKIKAMPM